MSILMKANYVLSRSRLRRMQNLYATLLISIISLMNIAQAEVVLDANFETSDFRSYDLIANGTPPKIDGAPNVTCSGSNGSAKFELNYGSKNGYRSEYAMRGKTLHNLNYGQDYWIGFGIFIPNDWVADSKSDTIFQMHSTPDTGEPNAVPPLAITIQNNNFSYRYRYDSNPITKVGSSSGGTGGGNLSTLKRGEWSDFVIHIKPSYQNDGVLQIWQDGDLKASRNGGNTYNDQLGPYLKIGNYKPSWRTDSDRTNCTWCKSNSSGLVSRTHYADELRVAVGSDQFSEVSPKCNGSAGQQQNISPPSNLTIISK